MKIGDRITLTREQFIRLAPMGLVLHADLDNVLFYFDPYAHAPYESSIDAIHGYVYTDSNEPQSYSARSNHLNGYWGLFDDGYTFTVHMLPKLHIYRRN